jgi:hypothetical protein
MKKGSSPKKHDGLERWERYRLKDLDAYRRKKAEYARTPKEREKRTAYMRKWRDKNRARHNELARKSHARNKHKHVERNREWWLRSHYGIGSVDYERLFDAQGRCCWICKRSYARRRLAVDHDHASGKVRRLLCSKCNGNLGWFEMFRSVITEYADTMW